MLNYSLIYEFYENSQRYLAFDEKSHPEIKLVFFHRQFWAEKNDFRGALYSVHKV